MVTAEVITGGMNQGNWIGVSVFFFLMWGIMIFFNENKRKTIKELRDKLKVK